MSLFEKKEPVKRLSDFNNHKTKCLGCGSTESPRHLYGEIFQCDNCGDIAHYKYFQIDKMKVSE